MTVLPEPDVEPEIEPEIEAGHGAGADPASDAATVPALTPRRRRLVGLAVIAIVLLLACVASLALGSKPLSPLDSVAALFTDNGDPHTIVVGQRIPRTVLAILVGAALAVAGALMQGMTRNPLADPGILGVSAGAAFAIVLLALLVPGVGRFGAVLGAFVGAVVITIAVYLVGTSGGRGSSPVTLILAGVAISAMLTGVADIIGLLSSRVFNAGRLFQLGSLENRGWESVGLITPFLIAGLLAAAAAAHGLNAVALGDDLAVSLGASQWWTRTCVIVGVTLLCGSATAAVGMVWFVGMMVPHVARWIVGPDQRWILAYTALLGPCLLVIADVVGRVVLIPDEIPAGVVTAFVGAPVLVWMVRRRGASGL